MNPNDGPSRWTLARACSPALLAALLGMGGCFGPGLGAGFDAPDPGARLHAVAQTARTNDRDNIPRLIDELDSDDPAMRMLSIRTLERLTGQTLGYDHTQPAFLRKEPIERWRTWLAQQGQASQNAPSAPGAPR